MNLDSLNRWLTLAANIGVLIGLLLLVAELNQNSDLMRAQIFNERAAQGIEQFMVIAGSRELSEIMSTLDNGNWPEDVSSFTSLTPSQQSQYRWYLRAERFRIENLLYQQLMGILELDSGPLRSAHGIITRHEIVNGAGGVPRLRNLIEDVEELHLEAGL